MSSLAAIRPDEWGLPVFLHILGALTLLGALALSVAFLLAAWRGASRESLRLALRTLTLGVIPAWVVLRVSAEWIADKEGINDIDEQPDWIEIGYIVGDAGFLLIVVSSLLAWFAYRRSEAGASSATVRVATVLIALLIVLNLVALWAMTTKPG
jgi:hypothetical protein